jgi:DNA polymerase V
MAITRMAGFPSPADDYVENTLDLHSYMVKAPSATFIARARGDAMVRLGIFDGDLLVVDRSIEPAHGCVVVASLEGEMVCKVLDLHGKRLLSGNERYPPVQLQDDSDLVIEGVVTFSVRHHSGGQE